MNFFYVFVAIVDKIDIIIYTISYISYFTMNGFNDICDLSDTAVYFIVIDDILFKLDLVVFKMNITNAAKIFKILQFIIVTIVTARMQFDINIMVLKMVSSAVVLQYT